MPRPGRSGRPASRSCPTSRATGSWRRRALATTHGSFASRFSSRPASPACCATCRMPCCWRSDRGRPSSVPPDAAKRPPACPRFLRRRAGRPRIRPCLVPWDDSGEERVEVDWAGFGEKARRRIALPTYPFSRTRHWIEPPAQAVGPAAPAPAPSVSDRRRDRTSWQEQPVGPACAPTGSWLLLGDDKADATPPRCSGKPGAASAGCVPATLSLHSARTRLRSGRTSSRITNECWPACRNRRSRWSGCGASGRRAPGGPRIGAPVPRSLPPRRRLAQHAVGRSRERARRHPSRRGRRARPREGHAPRLVRSAALEFPDRAIRSLDLPSDATEDRDGVRALQPSERIRGRHRRRLARREVLVPSARPSRAAREARHRAAPRWDLRHYRRSGRDSACRSLRRWPETGTRGWCCWAARPAFGGPLAGAAE